MQTLWMGVRPGPTLTRLLVQDGPIPILKARLPEAPHHPRALDHALEEASRSDDEALLFHDDLAGHSSPRLNLETFLHQEFPAHAPTHRDVRGVKFLGVDVPAWPDDEERVSGDPTDDLAVNPRAALEHEVAGEDGPFADEAHDIGALDTFRGAQPPLSHRNSPSLRRAQRGSR